MTQSTSRFANAIRAAKVAKTPLEVDKIKSNFMHPPEPKSGSIEKIIFGGIVLYIGYKIVKWINNLN